MKAIQIFTISLACWAAISRLSAQEPEYDPEFVLKTATYFAPNDRLDPHRTFYIPWDGIYRCLYETPLRCDQDSSIMNLEPHLLAEMPSVDRTGKKLRLHFKKGIRFHDDPCFENGKGREVKAADFAYVLKRHIDPRTQSPYFKAYLAGRLKGADKARVRAEKNRFLDYDEDVGGIKVLNDYEVELEFIEPYPRFPALMAMTWLSLLPAEAVSHYGEGISTHPVGTGPYLLDKKPTSKEELVLKRNDNYWNRDAGGKRGPLPWNKGVVFQLLKDEKKRIKRFNEGDLAILDLLPQHFDKFMDHRGKIRTKFQRQKMTLLKANSSWLHYVVFNCENKLLGKKKLRQALILATDRQRIIQEYYRGAAVLANHIVPPALPLGLSGRKALGWRYGKRDLERAKKLLAEAGHPMGQGLPEFVLETSSTGELAELETKIIKENWAEIGVKVQVRIQTLPELTKRMRAKQVEISIAYWIADYPDPDNFMMMLLASSQPSPGIHHDAPNAGFWTNADYEKLYRESARLVPGPERGKVYQKMIEIIQEECPWLFLDHQLDVAVLAPGLRGVKTRSNFATDYALFWCRPEKKTKK